MKFSLISRFARLSHAAFITVVLLEITGRIVTVYKATTVCMGWPLCSPQGVLGWVQLTHRFAVAVSAVLLLYLLQQAWMRLRDNALLLSLVTMTTVLFFMQALIGAMNTTLGFPKYLVVLHALTAVALWVSFFGLVISSALVAGDGLVEFPPLNWGQRVWDFISLTKPVIVALLLVTTFGGMIAGAKAIPSFALIFWTMLGGFMAAGGSEALNAYIDRELDKNMQRTAKRPIASGRMTPAEGLAFGLALSVMSFYILAVFVNLLAALLSLAGIIYYVFIYSILLKKVTVQNIVIGGGAGAIPPMVGWAAATGHLAAPAWFLFAIIFLWTPPHFWALSIVRKKDYERAGVPMMPVVRGEGETRWQIWLYTLSLVCISLLMPILKMTGGVFLLSAIALGAGFIYFAWRVLRIEGNKVAWQLYKYSSMYLMFIFLALVIDALV
jgi:protoheme IX farnesyltransferase